MNVNDIINESLINYDSTYSIINHLKNRPHNFEKSKINFIRDKIIFIEPRTGESFLETEVELLAMYHTEYKLWIWSWSMADLSEHENYLSKEILLYALKLEKEMYPIKSLLINSRMIVNDASQMDIILAISSNIIKQPYLFPIKNDMYIYYYILLDKQQINKLKI